MLNYPYYVVSVESFFEGFIYYSYYTCALKDGKYYLILDLEVYLTKGETEETIIKNIHSYRFINSFDSNRGYTTL